MNNQPIRIEVESRLTRCKATVDWDQDSIVLTVVFTCWEKEIDRSDFKLSERLDEAFGIGQVGYRLVSTDMEVMLDKERRIQSIEIRTNPGAWETGSLPPIPGNQESVNVDFIVDYDENQISSYNLPIKIIHDTPQRALGFCFGQYSSSKWVSIADGFVVGMTADYYLSEFRLLDFDLEL